MRSDAVFHYLEDARTVYGMSRNPEALDPELDRELDEALEMTFPASDPVAIVAPGSTSRVSDAPPTERRSAAASASPAPARAERRKR